MEETTEEQNKIRRGTLLISLLLLLCSVGSYYVYQTFYDTELHVTFVSKKVAANTKQAPSKTVKKAHGKSEKTSEKKGVVETKKTMLVQRPMLPNTKTRNDGRQNQQGSSNIFRLSDPIVVLP